VPDLNLRDLANLSETEVEEAVLCAIEQVVADGQLVPSLRSELKRALDLNSSQRIHLDHFLEHAAASDYVHASPPLRSASKAHSGVAHVQELQGTRRGWAPPAGPDDLCPAGVGLIPLAPLSG
jgi:hypothetical protein